MEYRVSARKWRPQTFEEVVGQDHVARTLKNAITADRVGSGYIFSGMRGVGKTTMARILAKALNCAKGPTPEPCGICDSCREIAGGTSMDVIEIDAASNRGIDEIRELRENIKYSPMGSRRKIYIIDEVHMLTEPAFNALLKTLEEPPAHAVFVLATTELRKIPATILSRCQHFQFRRISFAQIIRQLMLIADKEGLKLSPGGRAQIARASEGSLRDALSLLDQVAAFSDNVIRDEDVGLILGKIGSRVLITLVGHLADRDVKTALALSGELEAKGHDIQQICADTAELIRDLAIAKTSENPVGLIAMAEEDQARLKDLSSKFSYEELLWLFSVFGHALVEMRGPVRASIVFEMSIVKACRIGPVIPVEELIEKIESVEKRLGIAPSEGAPFDPIPSPRSSLSNLPGSSRMAEEPALPGASAKTPTDHRLEQWTAAVSAVKERRPNLGSYLEQGSLLRVTDREVVVGFQESAAFLMGLLQKEESLSLIRGVVQEIFGESLDFRLESLNAAAGPVQTLAREREEREREQKKRMIDDALANPVVQEVLNIFGGEVVEVKSPKSLLNEGK